MSQSWFELLKHTEESNTLRQILDTPIVNYGKIIEIIDTRTVIVQGIVQSSLSENIYTITLLNFSSALLEVSVEPKIGDKVLILFVQQFDSRMFTKDKVVNPNATGYNRYSGVGILMSAVKMAASTLMRFYKAGEETVLDIESSSKINGTFTEEVSLRFERLNVTNEDEKLISLVFGQGRTLFTQFLSKQVEEHGFWKDSDNELVELDAAVTKRYSIHSPITRDIQGTQTTDVGLGEDKDENPIETEAAVTETIHGKAPIKRIIRSPQHIIIGKGNAETEDEDEMRDAPVHIELGEESDITLESLAGIVAKIAKDVDILIKQNLRMEVVEDVDILIKQNLRMKIKENETVNVTDNAKHTSNDTDIESKKPMGIKGSGTQLGSGNLRKYWQGEQRAWLQRFIPPVAISIPLIPPVPPMICMGLNSIRRRLRSNASNASKTNSDVLK
jgi:hypothetical protein